MINKLLNPSDIIVGENRLRQVDPVKVEALVASMSEIGMKTPVSVREIKGSDPAKYELVAGHHRLQAVRRLQWTNIDAIIMVATNDLRARLWEIDENLCRNELSPVERAEHISARKEIYEEIHPETKAGRSQAAGMNAAVGNVADKSPATSFASATAAATGRDERSVRRDSERGDKVIQEVRDLIRGTALDTGAYLDKLKALPPNDQVFAAKRDLAERKRQEAERGQGGIARRIVPAAAPTDNDPALPSFDDFSAALKLLSAMSPGDFRTICPTKHLMLMRSRMAHLIQTFEQVMEVITE